MRFSQVVDRSRRAIAKSAESAAACASRIAILRVAGDEVVPKPGRFEVGRGKLHLRRLQLGFATCRMGRQSLTLRISRPDLVLEAGQSLLPKLARAPRDRLCNSCRLPEPLSDFLRREEIVVTHVPLDIPRAQTRFELRAPRDLVFDPEFLVVQQKDFTHRRTFHAPFGRGGMPSVTEIGPSYRIRIKQAQLVVILWTSHTVRDDIAERRARVGEYLGNHLVAEGLDCRNAALPANSQVGPKVLVVQVLINIDNKYPIRQTLACSSTFPRSTGVPCQRRSQILSGSGRPERVRFPLASGAIRQWIRCRRRRTGPRGGCSV